MTTAFHYIARFAGDPTGYRFSCVHDLDGEPLIKYYAWVEAEIGTTGRRALIDIRKAYAIEKDVDDAARAE